jgi:TolA-binding protein
VLGDEAGARKVWERVIAEHPKSDAARQARELLRRG